MFPWCLLKLLEVNTKMSEETSTILPHITQIHIPEWYSFSAALCVVQSKYTLTTKGRAKLWGILLYIFIHTLFCEYASYPATLLQEGVKGGGFKPAWTVFQLFNSGNCFYSFRMACWRSLKTSIFCIGTCAMELVQRAYSGWICNSNSWSAHPETFEVHGTSFAQRQGTYYFNVLILQPMTIITSFIVSNLVVRGVIDKFWASHRKTWHKDIEISFFQCSPHPHW